MVLALGSRGVRASPAVALGDVRQRMGGGVAAPRDPSIPSVSDEEQAVHFQLARHMAEQRALFHQLMAVVGTLDTIVYEHDTQELPLTQNFFTLTLKPQTTQVELITGVFASIVMPTTTANSVITLTNAWAKMGDINVNMNSIFNSFGAMGGMVPGIFTFVMRSEATRSCTIVSSGNWPSGAYLTFALFGRAVPALSGGVLH